MQHGVVCLSTVPSPSLHKGDQLGVQDLRSSSDTRNCFRGARDSAVLRPGKRVSERGLLPGGNYMNKNIAKI